MTPLEIRIELMKRGTNLSDLAVRHGLDITACRVALRKSWPRVEKIIADEIGVSVEEVFPNRYNQQNRVA